MTNDTTCPSTVTLNHTRNHVEAALENTNVHLAHNQRILEAINRGDDLTMRSQQDTQTRIDFTRGRRDVLTAILGMLNNRDSLIDLNL